MEHYFMHCRLRVLPPGSPHHIETVFHDGTVCPATLVEDAAALVHSRELGYPGVRQMHVEHEVSHTLLAEVQGLLVSPTLWNVAHPGSVPDDQRMEEEAQVFSFQRFMNTDVVDDRIRNLPLAILKVRVRRVALAIVLALPV